MSSITTIRCDVCHKEISLKERQRVDINTHAYNSKTHPWYSLDMCEECLDALLKGFNLKRKKK